MFCFVIRPLMQLSSIGGFMDIDCWCDSDWAGCAFSRKSTTVFFIFILGTVIQFTARTQAIPALSSAEAELYSMGSTIAEALHVKSFLEESGIAKRAHISIRTDSTSGK